MRFLSITIIFLFLSNHLFGATYLLCKVKPTDVFDNYSVVIDNNKILINYNNEGVEDYTDYIVKYTDIEIIIEKPFKKKIANFNCDYYIKHEYIDWFEDRDTVYGCSKGTTAFSKLLNEKNEEKVNNLILSLPPDKKRYIFDRISGIMDAEIEEYFYKIKNKNRINFDVKPYFSNTRYQCEISKKTLF